MRALSFLLLTILVLHANVTPALEVGALAGEAAVAPSGAALYTIPLHTPPGLGAAQPRLSLSYSSHSGNGPIGMGFSLSGLSQIARCPASMAPDGFIDPVDFDTNDRYCLDGQKLVASTGAYGAIGSEYRTEIATFSRIVSSGGTTHDPGSFKVWTRDGLVMEYGTTVDSRWRAALPSGNKALAWALARVTDAAGNDMTVRYGEMLGEPLPAEIRYGGNVAAGLAPSSTVTFVYEPRHDIGRRYVGGATLNQTQRLAAIYTSSANEAGRSYFIGYDEENLVASRVRSIGECVGPAACRPETVFTWQVQGSGWEASQTLSGTTGAGTAGAWLVDMNGDGMADYVTKTGNTIFWNLATRTGWGPNRSQSGLHGGGDAGNWFADIDGDGRVDYVTKNHDGTIYWNRSTGDGWGANQQQSGLHSVGDINCWFIDLNGDGRADYITKSRDNLLHWNLATATGWGPSQTQEQLHGAGPAGVWFADINGDALPDYITKAFDTTIRWNLNTGTGWGPRQSQTGLHAVGDVGVWFADINGDGMADYLTKSENGTIYWNLATGAGWAPNQQQSGLHGIGHGGTWFTDINGDGMADYVAKQHDGSMQWNLASGIGWGPPQTQTGLQAVGDAGTWLADVSGDGIVDYVTKSDTPYIYWNVAAAAHLQLSCATDGFGVRACFEYSALTDPAIYARGEGATYPQMELQGPLRVVRALRRSDGVGGEREVTHHYSQARFDHGGRGFLGFRTVTREDTAAAQRQVMTFRQDFPYVGMPDEHRVETLAGSPLSRSATTLGNRLLGASRFVHVAGTTHDENDPATGMAIRSTITDYTYGDDYGNVTGEVQRTCPGSGCTGTPHSTTIARQFAAPDLARWRIGQLTHSSVTRTGPGITPLTRTQSFEYAAATGLLAAETVEPDQPTQWLRTSHEHDELGNVTRSTLSGPDITARSHTVEYDKAAPHFGRFATRVVNALGHAETRSFAGATGAIVSTTSANGLVTQYSQDPWGRPASEQFSQHGITNSRTIERHWCTELADCRTGELARMRQVDGSGAESKTYSDRLGRVVRTARKTGGGAWVETRTEYDALGRVQRTSAPYFAGQAAQHWTETGYDAYGRVASVRSPAGLNSPACTRTLTYSPLATTARDCANRPTTNEVDLLGRRVKLTDALGGVNLYTYDAFDNLLTTRDPDNSLTTLRYDARGRKVEMTDADRGRWTHAYNALGEMTSQSSPNGKTIAMTYDVIGRMVRREQGGKAQQWTWDTLWKGALTQVSDPDYRRTLAYTPFGAVASEEVVIFTRSPRVTQYGYDSRGRLSQTTHPSGLVVQNRYNAHGALDCVMKAGGNCYWEAREWDAWGGIAASRLGNGVETYRSRDAATGTLDAILSGRNGGLEVQSLNYAWSEHGTLAKRIDQNQGGLEEAFGYDGLERITTASRAGTTSLAATYSPSGNVLSKSGVGAYTYGTRPHAARQAGAIALSYDADGNLTTGGGASGTRVIHWNAYGLPWRIDDGPAFAQLHYSPEGRRVYLNATSSAGTRTVHYFTPTFEEHKVNASTVQRHSIVTPEGVAAVETWNGPTFVKLEYVHKDHLGSIDAITDASGAVVERMSFDAFGKRRGASWQGAGSASSRITRGYTGHEMLDEVGLIHMNGRVYDPQLGRFMSADPLPNGSSTQGLNAYAYVDNNPLSATDPMGWSKWHSVWKNIEHFHRHTSPSQHVAEGRINYMQKSETYQSFTDVMAVVGTWRLGGYIAGAHTAFRAYANGNSLEDSVRAGGRVAAGAYAAAYVDANVPVEESPVTNIGLQGAVGGATTKALGGTFREGFYYAATAAALPYFFEFVKTYTDRIKLTACAQVSAQKCVYDGHGDLRTDGTRDARYAPGHGPGDGNFLTKSGMEPEGSGLHVYAENSGVGYLVNAISKVHDAFNSWGYGSDGWFVNRGEFYNTAFQLYSFAGMPVAAGLTVPALLGPSAYYGTLGYEN